MSRSIVAVEMLTVNKNGIMEFKETPAIAEVKEKWAIISFCKYCFVGFAVSG